MSLSTFIRDNQEEIIIEFSAFAKTLMPSDADMSEEELRDHAAEILTAVAKDMGISQTADEQVRKSQGLGTAQTMEESGALHADDRIQHGYSSRAVLAEFRALRATVLQRYEVSGHTDLSEVRRFNEALDEALTASMNRFAIRTDLFRDQFIGVLSHDLRTPLAAIAAGLFALGMMENKPDTRELIISRMSNSAKRMDRMIRDLLDLTRVRLGGAIPLNRQKADLRQVCEAVMEELHTTSPESVLRLETSGSMIGDWDSDRLAQVISNLLGNAIQHGGGTPITLTAQEEGDEVSVAVHNGGQPIPAAAIPLVFEPLRRGHEEYAAGNIGLGLFIARAIVSAHGGNIRVTSSGTAGTTFKVTLPRQAPSI
jgi:signal transduction histidine kinase